MKKSEPKNATINSIENKLDRVVVRLTAEDKMSYVFNINAEIVPGGELYALISSCGYNPDDYYSAREIPKEMLIGKTIEIDMDRYNKKLPFIRRPI